MIKKVAHQVEAKDLQRKLVKQIWSESLGANICQHHMFGVGSKIDDKVLAL